MISADSWKRLTRKRSPARALRRPWRRGQRRNGLPCPAPLVVCRSRRAASFSAAQTAPVQSGPSRKRQHPASCRRRKMKSDPVFSRIYPHTVHRSRADDAAAGKDPRPIRRAPRCLTASECRVPCGRKPSRHVPESGDLAMASAIAATGAARSARVIGPSPFGADTAASLRRYPT